YVTLTFTADVYNYECVLSPSKLVCYYTSWSKYRPAEGKFTVSDVDPHLCTYLIFPFSGINNANELVPNDRGDTESYQKLNGLKARNPNLKTILAVGGFVFGTQRFSTMASTAANRMKFIQSSIDLFTLLCKELLSAYQTEGKASSRPRLVVTAAVGAGKAVIDASYEIAEIAKYLDFVNVMTFDLYGVWDNVTGHHSPLNQRSQETGNHIYLNSAFAMRYWHSQDIPTEKLNLGFAAYGRTFTLSSQANGIGAPILGVGNAGRYTREAGFWSYYEVCLNPEGKTVHWIEDQEVPYGVAGNQWVGFDKRENIDVNFLKENYFGAAFVWSLDLDDFNGQFCKQGKHPLVSHLRSLLMAEYTCNPTMKRPVSDTTTITMPSSAGGPDTEFCRGKTSGLYPNPNDPNSFFSFFSGITSIQSCPPSLLCNDICKCCDWPKAVVCHCYYFPWLVIYIITKVHNTRLVLYLYFIIKKKCFALFDSRALVMR
uniref:chitinase n=1 Tax=Echeneis naucrates TaxID=173247 RepID=A0A665TBE2_ECHNA